MSTTTQPTESDRLHSAYHRAFEDGPCEKCHPATVKQEEVSNVSNEYDQMSTETALAHIAASKMQTTTMLTLAEAAALLNLSPVTLRLQIRNKKLKAVKRGRDWHVSRREVDRYAVENRRLIPTTE